MTVMTTAARMLWRDFRAGELTILILAMLIAVTSSTAVSLFADRLERTMTDQAAEFLAADLVVTSHAAISDSWLEKANDLDLNAAQSTEFSSVIIHGDELLLTSVKAVSSAYPLRGSVKTTLTGYTQEIKEAKGPSPGSAWVEQRVLTALGIHLGDRITVGEKQLTASKIITYEPDKQGNLYSLSPRILMNDQDLSATGVIQPGSHVHYFFQFSGEENNLSSYKQWLKPQLNLAQRLMDIHDDRPELGSALNRAERYLGLSSIVVIVIAGVAIAMATRRYTERHLDTSALLRCFGYRQNQVIRFYLYQFLLLGIITSVLGCLLGWQMQSILFKILKNLLPQSIAQPGLLAVVMGIVTGITVLTGFALPPLLQLKKVSPARVLRRDLEPLPISAWLVYGLAGGLVSVLVWRYTDDLTMTITLAGGGLVLVIMLALLIQAMLLIVKRILPYVPLSWRFGLQGMVRHRQAVAGQIIAFSITLVAMILSFNVRNELLTNWQRQLPEHAPNHFVLNLFPDQIAPLQQAFNQEKIENSRFFPIVRGRLTKINGKPVQKIVTKDSQGDSATHRELSLTWTDVLPEDNKIVAGEWFKNEDKNSVSVEEKLAESLGLLLGDELHFIVGGQQLTAKVTSFRSLRWDTMKPNFYMIFSPGALTNYPSTYLTSFFLPQDKKTLLNQWVKQYPAITILEVEQLIKQFQTIIGQLSQAINYLLYFALSAGFLVLFSAIYSSLDIRIHESALLRTFGAQRSLLRTAHFIEFLSIGCIAGIMAVLISEVLLYVLYSKVIHMDYRPAYKLWLILPTMAAITVAFTGAWALRHIVRVPPLRILRDS